MVRNIACKFHVDLIEIEGDVSLCMIMPIAFFNRAM